MTDAEAIEMAKRYGLPIVSIPPLGAIDEVIAVDFRDDPPTVTRRPSRYLAAGQSGISEDGESYARGRSRQDFG